MRGIGYHGRQVHHLGRMRWKLMLSAFNVTIPFLTFSSFPSLNVQEEKCSSGQLFSCMQLSLLY